MKWIYKFMALMAFMLLGLHMFPEKEVKALENENDYAPVLVKTEWVHTYFDVEWENHYEFVVTYKLDKIFIWNLNRFEYFFVTTRYFSIYPDRFVRDGNSYVIEEIHQESNSTVIYVRMVLSKSRIIQYYGGLENIDELFSNESAFYVWVTYDDLAGYAYDAGYNDGHIDGRNLGYQEGYLQGHDEGYQFGVERGREFGYGEGYEDGYLIGLEEGKEEGKTIGYNDGYGEGYEIGKSEGYDLGYNEGYSKGYNIGMNIQHNKFSDLLNGVFTAIGTFLGIRLFPGITIGAIIAIPIVFGVIAFILGRRRG